MREAGQVRDAAVLVASGITPAGERQVLGVSVSLSEHETHWKAFLQGLKDRGMQGVQLVISDDHAGLGAARRAVLGSVPWQRCQFHLQQNAGAYVPKQAMRMEVAADIRSMFNAPDRKTAEEFLSAAIQKYAVSAPDCQPGWKRTWQKGLQCLTFHWSIEDRSEPRTAWKGSTKRSADELGLGVSSERGLVFEIGFRFADGNQRGMADRKTLLRWQVIRLLKIKWIFLTRIYRKKVA